ncbi:PE domain-containing protein [Actinokineospora iranica]|uniref:PE family protein n=1 Tax=Actinokineospora iranica TaxID=1271860 RepID=A0A1G6Q6X0_9PSEU|nr:PE domain-containing protein [Actinokineospora iranica]SDC88222.1 PE family protein [Actinokineospora iranica]
MNIGAAVGGAAGAVAGAAMHAADQLLKNLPSASPGGQFVVNHDNVLTAAKIIQSQVETLADEVIPALETLQVVPPGNDIVSEKVATAWNERLVTDSDSYQVRVREYVASLRNLVSQLIESARNYGYNEDEIVATLGGDQRA